jgi:hypothetical protein
MNKYGYQAMEHWRRWLPNRYQQIEDPTTYFESLGEEIQSAVSALSRDLAGDDPGGETFLQKVGRLNMAKLQAEEIALKEHALLEPESDSEESPQAST